MADLELTDNTLFGYLNDPNKPHCIVTNYGGTFNPAHDAHIETMYAAALQEFKYLLQQTRSQKLSYEQFLEQLRQTNFLLVVMPAARNPVKKNAPKPGKERIEILKQLIHDKHLASRLQDKFEEMVSTHFDKPRTRSLSSAIQPAIKIHISTHECSAEVASAGSNEPPKPSYTVDTLTAIRKAAKNPDKFRLALTLGADSFEIFATDWSKPQEIVKDLVDSIGIVVRDGVKWSRDKFIAIWMERSIKKALDKKKAQMAQQQLHEAREKEAKRAKPDVNSKTHKTYVNAEIELTADELAALQQHVDTLMANCEPKCQDLADFQPSPFSSTALRTAIESASYPTIAKMTSAAVAELILKYYATPEVGKSDVADKSAEPNKEVANQPEASRSAANSSPAAKLAALLPPNRFAPGAGATASGAPSATAASAMPSKTALTGQARGIGPTKF